MLDKLINWITCMITGIDMNSMNFDEFFTWWTTMFRVRHMVYTALDVTAVAFAIIAVIGVAYLIVGFIADDDSEVEKA